MQAQRVLGNDYQVEILEIHHEKKNDAPSGTALAVGRALAEQGGLKEVLRGEGVRGQCEVGYASLRGGDVPGEHTVFFIGKGERLEITHRAMERAIFARGALRALRVLVEKQPGLYSMQDLF